MFIREFQFAVVCAIVLGSTSFVRAAETTTGSANAILKLWFRDAERGTAIIPHFLTVDEKPVYKLADSTGRLDLPVTAGDHQIVVKAKGYDEMRAKEHAREENSPMNIVMLDPSETPEELRPENQMKLIKPDSSAMVGYVVDEITCEPIKDALVSIEGTSVTATTDEGGFFGITVPAPDAGPLPESKDTDAKFIKRNFSVSKPGYGTEVRTSVLLMTNEPKKFQFRLVPGGATNTMDEEKDRGGLQQWTFGLPGSEHEHDPIMHDEHGPEGTTTTQEHNHDHH